jgi:NADH pyrophosphatase NudC (nudix superfamily)
MPTMVPDRGGHENRRPGSYMQLVSKAKNSIAKGDNPAWKCESCGKKGAMNYAGQGRVCQSCANERGF